MRRLFYCLQWYAGSQRVDKKFNAQKIQFQQLYLHQKFRTKRSSSFCWMLLLLVQTKFQFSLRGQYRLLLDRRFSHLQTVLDTSSNDARQNNYHTTEVGRNNRHKLSKRVLISSERTLVQSHACSNHNIVCSTDRICVSDPWDRVYLLYSLPKASSDQQHLCHGSQRQALDSFAFCKLMCPIFVYFGPWNRYLKLSVSQKFPK